MKQKRFDELTLFKTWVVPAGAFWLCAAGFVGGVIAEKKQRPQQASSSTECDGAGSVAHPRDPGAIAIGMYSWFFGLAVVDAERKRVAKGRGSDES